MTQQERASVKAAVSVDFSAPGRKDIGLADTADYPERLSRIPNPPPALFYSGSWEATSSPAVGIVGTRSASAYGRAAARKFAEAFASAGVTVVSGGAMGIDAEAHKGALSVGGRTVAVLAGGVDVVYPRIHSGLFLEIKAKGCLVSQFPVGSKPWQSAFLIRNHLIAALSDVVVVVESPERSGALSTAGAANDLSRDVYVVPANIDNANFRGSHGLIRDGAILVDHPNQVLEDLGISASTERAAETSTSPLGGKIVAVLSVEPLSAERISERTGIPAADVLSELTILEMDGLVRRHGGGYAVPI